MRHRWHDNTCIHCKLKRERQTWKLLMAITGFPPYNHYQYGTAMAYLVDGKWTFKRPDCKRADIDVLRETIVASGSLPHP